LLGTPHARVALRPAIVRILAEGFPALENPVVDERDVPPAQGPPPHPTLFALGLNYADHASELDFKPPTEPLVFIKAPNTFNGDNQTSVRPDNVEYMHYEAELVVVIGKTARKVSEAEAMDYVAGYTVCNDYAIRDYLENYYRPNLRVKSRDGLTPISPTSCRKSHSRPAQPGPAHLRQRRAAPGRHHGRSDLQHPVPDRLPERIYDPAAGRHDRHRHAERAVRRGAGR
jgi:5-oxopent-3-ene-1,2,5-tricarboxylate decarboxylase/2-hydroxyhepta-2,4-diene-1,7-dioate isomerase